MTNPTIINIADLPNDPNDPNGPTIREANQKLQHKIPIDTLVEVKFDSWYGDGACLKAHARLYVIAHNRDCDGTPLYTLADKKREVFEYFIGKSLDEIQSLLEINQFCSFIDHGFGEEQLASIEITDEIKNGKDSLYWKENE